MTRSTLLPFLLVLLLLNACKEDAIELPTTYNFNNVDYSGQTTRLNMLGEISAMMKSANNGAIVDGNQLANMFANENNAFSSSELNTSSKQLKNKCYDNIGSPLTATTLTEMLMAFGNNSVHANSAWSPENAGVATSGSKKYFLDEYGVEYTQIVEKGIMGAVFYYQMAEHYTREGQIGASVDNTIVVEGKGTDMEHHWDEAFGYLGAPINLNGSNVTSMVDDGLAIYHAKYSEIGQLVGLETTDKVMKELIKGRHAISRKDDATKLTAAAQLREEWERIIATTFIHYINGALSDFSDPALRNHQLSEAYAFLISLYYNTDRKISNEDMLTMRSYFETDVIPNGTQINLLHITSEDLVNIRNSFSPIYNLESVKTIL